MLQNHRVAGSHPLLAWKAQRCIYRCSFNSGNFEDAIEEADELLELAPSRREGLYVEMDILMMEQFVDADRINAEGEFERRMVGLEALVGETIGDNGFSGFEIPDYFELGEAYPNSFNSTTNISYQLPEESRVILKTFDISGREVEVLFSGGQDAGAHQTLWNSQGAATGSYLLRLESSGIIRTQKLILVK